MNRLTFCLRLLVSCGLVLVVSCTTTPREVSETSAVFDPTLAGGFWSMPWPGDQRRVLNEDGSLGGPDMSGFPNPSENGLLGTYLELSSVVLDGFGLNSPIFFAFDGPVTLPDWDQEAIEASALCEGPIRIMNIDANSPDYGDCVPARWKLSSEHIDPYLSAHHVAVAPYWGFPLAESTLYAVLLTDISDGSGAFLQAPVLLQELLEGRSDDSDLQAIYQPLAEALGTFRNTTGEVDSQDEASSAQWIASATVFTTQDATSEMEFLSDFIRSDSQYPKWEADLTLLDSEHEHFQTEYEIYDGSYLARNFQRGVRPYASEGGGFHFKDGQPAGMSEERIPFVIGTPRSIQVQPESGWPVIIHSHGTTGDRFSHLTGGNLRPGYLAANRGFLSIGIPQPFHGERWPEGNGTLEGLYSFNYFNPESGRSTFRQGALDTVTVVEFVRRHMSTGGSLAENYPQLRINPDEIYFVGHSQGGITGAIALPSTQGIKGWVLSGAGGGLSTTIMQREDPLVIRDTMLTALGAPDGTQLFEMHPLIGMVQMLAETTDPINYAKNWLGGSTGDAASILLTEGLLDEQTPADTTETLAVAGGLPIARPYRERDVLGMNLAGLEERRTPYTANTLHQDGSEVTTGLAQFDRNHFAIFNDGDAAVLWANFLYSQVRDGGPGELGADFP